jgi:hypothetical protein
MLRLITMLTLLGSLVIITGCAEDTGDDDGDSKGMQLQLLGDAPADFDADAEYE